MSRQKFLKVLVVGAILVLCCIAGKSSEASENDAQALHFHDYALSAPTDEKREPQGEGIVQFRILVVHGKTAALIDSIKIIDREGKIVAALDVGCESDTKGENRVVISDENQWGSPKQEGAITARGVNEGNKRSMHSSFMLKITRAPGLRIVIRYKDQGEDLMPVEIFDDQDFRRIGQILLENSGQWLEEEFRIPDTGTRKHQ
jgi:hypothetical protein